MADQDDALTSPNSSGRLSGAGLRNFRMNRDQAVKGQATLLRYFRNEGKNRGSNPPDNKESSDSSSNGRSTSPILNRKICPSPTHSTNTIVWLPSKDDKSKIVQVNTSNKFVTKTLTKPLFVDPPSPEEVKVKEEMEEFTVKEEEVEEPARNLSTTNLITNMKKATSSDSDHEISPKDNGSIKEESGDWSSTPLNRSLNMKRSRSSDDNDVKTDILDLDQDSQESPLVRTKGVKRARLLASSDEDEDDDKPENINGHDSTDVDDLMPDDDSLQKYLEMWEMVYTYIPKMELFDVFRDNKWDVKLTMRKFGVMNKEYKIQLRQKKIDDTQMKKKDHAQKREDLKQVKKAEKELEANARKTAKEKVKAQKELRKVTQQRREVEDIEEEEDDYQFGGTKVYDSDEDDEEEENHEEEETENEVLKKDRELVMQFFNDGTLGELAAIGGCSKKKAEVIIEARPFANWADIVYKFKSERYISPDLLNEAKVILHVRSTVQRLMKRCETIARDMQDIVENIISGVEDVGISSQPESLNPDMQLKGYQLIGLNWLVLMHQQGLNGVLADEMGLGKTVQAISFLAHIKETEAPETFSLIIVPSSTLDNWARELELWCPDIEVLHYHGTQDDRRAMRADILNNAYDEIPDVILTTYNMVSSNPEDRALFKKLRFHAVILDEAHMLKNMASIRYENLMKIKSQRRILLTGTPLQNNLVELMSILIFVMPQLFDSKKEELKRVFSMFPKSEDGSSKSKFERERVEQAKRIMKPFFLRRLKCDVLKDLPAKKDEINYAPMSERQQKIYQKTVNSFSNRARQHELELEKLNMKQLSELEELEATAGSPKKSVREKDASSNIVMTLRKIANHPLLTRIHYTDSKLKEISKILKRTSHQDSVLEYIIEDFSVMSDYEIHTTCRHYPALKQFRLTEQLILDSGKFQQLDILLPQLKKEGARVLVFSQFVIVLNILEAYVKIRGHKYLRFDGSTPVTERQDMIDKYTENEDIFLFLLSTRAGGLGVNLTAANTVILHDIDFNPYNDKQAEDRCHRVGQTRPVRIIRLISKGTIEEGMLKIGQDKLQLERDVTGLAEDRGHRKGDVLSLLKDALGLSKKDENAPAVAPGPKTKPTQDEDDEDEASEQRSKTSGAQDGASEAGDKTNEEAVEDEEEEEREGDKDDNEDGEQTEEEEDEEREGNEDDDEDGEQTEEEEDEEREAPMEDQEEEEEEEEDEDGEQTEEEGGEKEDL